MFYRKMFLSATLLFFLCACGASTAKSEAEALASKYFEAVEKGSPEEALPLYGDLFYKATTKEEWLKILNKVREKLGPAKSHVLANWNVSVQANTSGSGSYVTLNYNVKYALYDAQENLVIFKPMSGGEVKILGHHINSKGLLLQ